MKWKLFRLHLITLHATFDYTRQNKNKLHPVTDLKMDWSIFSTSEIGGNGEGSFDGKWAASEVESCVNKKVLAGQVNPGTA